MMSAVASPQNEVMIRQPLVLRIYVIAFLIFWEGTLVRTLLLHARGGAIAFLVVFAALGLAFGYRLFRIGVRSGPDGTLTVRNNVSTRVFTGPEIEAFRLGISGNRLGEQSLQVLLRDGTVFRLDIGRTASGPGRKRNARSVQSLTNWLPASA